MISPREGRGKLGKQIRKVNRMLGVSSSHHRQHAQEQKAAATVMLRESSPSPEKRQEYHCFSFLDAEEKARLSMPSFLASSESAKSNPYVSSNIGNQRSSMNEEGSECNKREGVYSTFSPLLPKRLLPFANKPLAPAPALFMKSLPFACIFSTS